nr:protein-ADP-ribose hydrolase [Enterococcus sp. 9E7_DIV0242]
MDYLIEENQSYRDLVVPVSIDDKRALFRSLMNVRAPEPIDEEFLVIQNSYLQKQLSAKQVFRLSDSSSYSQNLFLWQGDITLLAVDGIVNAANNQLLGCFVPLHRCIDNAIHSAAGVQLRLACFDLMEEQKEAEETGKVKVTFGYNLPAHYVFHTVGPIVSGVVTEKNEEQLAQCYESVLAKAQEMGLETLAFCCISTGEFRFPNDLAAKIAITTVQKFIKEKSSHLKVIFNVFNDTDKELYHDYLQKIS